MNRVDILWTISHYMATCVLQFLDRMTHVILSTSCELNLFKTRGYGQMKPEFWTTVCYFFFLVSLNITFLSCIVSPVEHMLKKKHIILQLCAETVLHMWHMFCLGLSALTTSSYFFAVTVVGTQRSHYFCYLFLHVFEWNRENRFPGFSVVVLTNQHWVAVLTLPGVTGGYWPELIFVGILHSKSYR